MGVLADTNVIIEAVRTRCWNALTGALRIESVETCRDEALAGNPHRAGYVTVGAGDLARLGAVHPVSVLERATFGIHYPNAAGMDDGERDLFAHAYRRASAGDDLWLLCSPDRASIRAAVALGWAERLESLEALVERVGGRCNPPLAEHFGKRWLAESRTRFLLEP